MVDLFDSLYASIVNKNNFLKRIRYYSLLRFITRWGANVIIPIYFHFTKRAKNYSLEPMGKTGGHIIVSITSYPARIRRIWLVIETILRQSKRPDKIILWLSKQQFPSLDLLPSILLKQKARGLEIRLMNEDIRSHKKYYYTLQEYPKDYLLIIDDDIFYRTTMIENMFRYSLQYPGSVISQYNQKILWEDGKLKSYLNWKRSTEVGEPNYYTFFGSGGGTFFPPNSMDNDVLNKSLFMSLTPTADDVWLNTMCRLKHTKITNLGLSTSILPVITLYDATLYTINANDGLNDIQLNSIRDYYITYRGIDPYQDVMTNLK